MWKIYSKFDHLFPLPWESNSTILMCVRIKSYIDGTYLTFNGTYHHIVWYPKFLFII